MKRFLLVILFAALAVQKNLAASEAPAPHDVSCSDECCDCPCQHCGCQAHCHAICHPVCEWKDVKETVYSCRCTDICIPGRSEKVCTKIDECNPDNCPLCHDYKALYTIWNPAECAGTRSVTKLYKHEVSHKVPTYKWVVEYCCDSCCNQLSQNTVPAEAGDAPKQVVIPGTTATQIAAAPKPSVMTASTSPKTPAAPQLAQAAPLLVPTPQNSTLPQLPALPQLGAIQPAQQGNIAQLAGAVQPPAGMQPAIAAQPDSAVQPASAIQEMGAPREFSMLSPPFPATNSR